MNKLLSYLSTPANKAILGGLGAYVSTFLDKFISTGFPMFYDHWWAPFHDYENGLISFGVGFLIWITPNLNTPYVDPEKHVVVDKITMQPVPKEELK